MPKRAEWRRRSPGRIRKAKVGTLPDPRSPNLVTNGDFAAGVTGWEAWGCTLATDAADYARAAPSLAVSGIDAWGGPYQGGIPVVPGEAYGFGATVKLPLGELVLMQLNFYDAGGAWAENVLELTGTGEWEVVVAQAVATDVAVSQELGFYAQNVIDFKLDDVFVATPDVGPLSVERDPVREAAVITLTGFSPNAKTYTVTRTSPSGTTVGVRGAVGVDTQGQTTIIVRDWEVPFGVPVVYRATFTDVGGAVTDQLVMPYTHEWNDCRAYLVDIARPTNSLPLVIEAFGPLGFQVPAGVHRVLDRRAPVLVTQVAWTPEGELVLLTDTLIQRDQVRNVLGSGYPILVRTEPEQGIGNMYLGVTSFDEERILTLGDAEPRRFTVSTVQVERPDAAIFAPQPPMTYQLVKDEYATYADLKAGVATYDDLAYTFPLGPVEVTPGVPWLPDDV